MKLLLALLLALLTGCTTLQDRAEGAAVADGVTTIAGVALGAAEASPLGLATVIVKYPLLEYVKTLPADEQAAFHASAGAIWGGAAVNNLCVVVALLTGGAIAPACLIGGIGYGLYAWGESAPKREFYAKCAEAKRAWAMDEKCVFKLEG